MRINGHAHVFNLQTVLTTEAIDIMVARIARQGYPSFITEAARKFLLRQLEQPEYLTEEGLLRRFLSAIGESADFKSFVAAQGATLPVDVRLIGGGVEALAVETLRGALDHLSTSLDPQGAIGRGVFDLYETLRLAMHPDIVSVADAILRQIPGDGGHETGLVALMMDIVAEPEPPADRRRFLAQLRGTSDAALARPGRIFPFIAVNPKRPEHLTVMREALERNGFVGVKLYPSLGYEVTTSEMDAVLDYCEREDVPIVVHTTAGGFYKSQQTAEFSNPKHWRTLLESHPHLRVSFAHCGGWGGLCNQEPDQVLWWREVVEFMRTFPNVYGDLSYHVEMRTGTTQETAYFGALRKLLADSSTSTRIIFGTDSWLVRMAIAEEPYWRYFESQLSTEEFRLITEVAPAQFLGLPVDGEPARANIERHVAWLAARATAVGAEPAAWVTALTNAHFTPTRTNLRWSQNNLAHVRLYQFLRFEVKQLPGDIAALPWDDAGKVRLRQLTYFTKGHEPDAMFANRCRENAANLDLFLRNAGAAYEGSYDSALAREKLRGLFDDGGATLAEAAASIDAIYLFATEV